MSTAAQFTFLAATLLLSFHTWIYFAPDSCRASMTRFPRSRLPALLFTFLALLGFALNLWSVDFGGLSMLKRLLIPAVPLAWYLITKFLPDLLSVRSLAALLLLAGNPLLVHTRWQGTPASLIFGLLVYLMVVKALFLVAYPHLWIRGVNWTFATPRRARTLAISGWIFGILLLVAAWISR